MELPHLAPETDHRIDVFGSGPANDDLRQGFFFQAPGSGAVDVVRRTFMNASVRTVRNSSGSTPGSAFGFCAKKSSILPGASSMVAPPSACSSFARIPAGSDLNVPLKLTDWI